MKFKFLDQVDKKVFYPSGIVAIALIIWSYVSSDSFNYVFSNAFNFSLDKFGWLYILFYTAIVIGLLALAFSKYGNVKLGRDDEEPEFSLGVWIAMLFSAGQGVGLTFYGVAEPIDHFYKPIVSEALSREAMVEACYQSTFHFGPQPWAGYIIVGLIIAYYQFRKGLPGLMSTGLYPILGEKGLKGRFARFIDGYTIILSLIGISASLALASAQMSAGLNSQFGIPSGLGTQLAIILIATVIFTYTSAKGVSDGMARISDFNVNICYGLLIAIVLLGPTVFILELIVESLGGFIANFTRMSFALDATGAIQEKLGFDWMKTWTVYWWAYYLAWTPFVGIFVARISRGRTIRQLILGAIILPTLLSHVWCSIFGGSALYLDVQSGGAIGNAVFGDISTAIYALYQQLPFTKIFTIITLFSISFFILTSADSANFCISALTTKGELNPPAPVRIFWGIILGAFAGLFLFIGGISGIQNLQFIFGLPFIFVIGLAFILLIKYLITHELLSEEELVRAEKSTQIEEEKLTSVEELARAEK